MKVLDRGCADAFAVLPDYREAVKPRFRYLDDALVRATEEHIVFGTGLIGLEKPVQIT